MDKALPDPRPEDAPSPIVAPAPERPSDGEWLETDGQGGYATGPVAGPRTRRYHGLLVAATDPPRGRRVLVAGAEAWIECPRFRVALGTQRYAPDVVGTAGGHPAATLEGFELAPWPTWTFRLPCGARIRHEILMTRQAGQAIVSWCALGPLEGATLVVRPLLAGRDAHALLREGGTPASTRAAGGVTRCRLADGSLVSIASDGAWHDEPTWYRSFAYAEERARGFDFVEDLWSPGVLRLSLAREAGVVLHHGAFECPARDVSSWIGRTRDAERRRRTALGSPLRRAADHYVVRARGLPSLIAGYPWFADWGRDTFIAVRGLLTATGRHADALGVLVAWSRTLSLGMVPNRFPDRPSANGSLEEPEYNSVDASLWYVVAAGELLAACDRDGVAVAAGDRRLLEGAILAIVDAYRSGTRFGIAADADGLLRAGTPGDSRGSQLTWMDARSRGREVTPRIGKPVEVNALWINALHVAAALDSRIEADRNRAMESFRRRFWNASARCLHDVVDVDHVAGAADPTIRPNQILAVGGLPVAAMGRDEARAIVDIVERELWTPLGLRSLARSEPGYAPRYEGGPDERDATYHQGTVWPWLIGAFVEAWVRVRGDTPAAREAARERFVGPLRGHLARAGFGHVSEIADAEPPHVPRGCPFQAWSLGELLRLEEVVLRTREPVAFASTR